MVIKTIWAIRKKSSESDYGNNEASDARIIVPRDPSNSPGSPPHKNISQNHDPALPGSGVLRVSTGSSDWANDSTLKYRQQTVCTLLSTGLINMHFYGIVFVKERSERKSLKYICLFSALYTLCTRDPVTAPVPSLTR